MAVETPGTLGLFTLSLLPPSNHLMIRQHFQGCDIDSDMTTELVGRSSGWWNKSSPDTLRVEVP